MSLTSRIMQFDRLVSALAPVARPSPLVMVVAVPPAVLQRIRHATVSLLAACLPDREMPGTADGIIEWIEAHVAQMPNLTPGGLVVPKWETALAYNVFVRAFADVSRAVGLDDVVQVWMLYPNLRIKMGVPGPDSTARAYPTEARHCDSWVWASPCGVGIHLPLFGDLEHNALAMYEPPTDFEEAWLAPRPSYQDGAAIADRYTRLEFVPPAGMVTLWDFAVLHASERRGQPGPRISIDTACICHGETAGYNLTPSVFAGLGTTHLLTFPESLRDPVSPSHHHPGRVIVLQETESLC